MLINTQKDSAQTVLVLHYTGGGMKEYRSRYKGEQKRALCTIMRSALTWTFHNSWGQWDKKEGDKDFPSTQKARCFFLQLFSSLRFKCLYPALSPPSHPLVMEEVGFGSYTSSARSPAHAGICELVVGSRFKEHEWMNAIPPVSTALEVFSREDGDQQWELARQ